jgi:AICAR transformylase/IMP cyclohydrolase PurH
VFLSKREGFSIEKPRKKLTNKRSEEKMSKRREVMVNVFSLTRKKDEDVEQWMQRFDEVTQIMVRETMRQPTILESGRRPPERVSLASDERRRHSQESVVNGTDQTLNWE